MKFAASLLAACINVVFPVHGTIAVLKLLSMPVHVMDIPSAASVMNLTMWLVAPKVPHVLD